MLWQITSFNIFYYVLLLCFPFTISLFQMGLKLHIAVWATYAAFLVWFGLVWFGLVWLLKICQKHFPTLLNISL